MTKTEFKKLIANKIIVTVCYDRNGILKKDVNRTSWLRKGMSESFVDLSNGDSVLFSVIYLIK